MPEPVRSKIQPKEAELLRGKPASALRRRRARVAFSAGETILFGCLPMGLQWPRLIIRLLVTAHQ
jgi:hypothetical protein